jgi:hypothetical protein
VPSIEGVKNMMSSFSPPANSGHSNGSNLGFEGLGRFAAAPQSNRIMRPKKFRVEGKNTPRTCEDRIPAVHDQASVGFDAPWRRGSGGTVHFH